MADHYYSKKPSAASSPRELKESVLGTELSFTVDSGVFSKGGLDFGSRLLLESLEEAKAEGRLIDAGCGWGPIGIFAAVWYPARPVLMVDVNERSVELSRRNADRNGATRAEVRQQDLLEGLDDDSAAMIVSNPPVRAGKEVVFRLYEQAWRVLKQNGTLTIVIQKKQGAPSTKAKLEELGFTVETAAKKKGYFIFRAEKH
ncbi:class I SAM-dependent methyltransferase [Alkalicoccus luteus]|uniref:Class I SAM-dependent methyltransferase n=1 Tax=Alkalicoccus luteus TaxID=1237094 RepID=A0A969TRX8_9BACI|nr:methyltransferase [Alkalicoccus luteus]NJP35993.1 class I SAM-dependent methyltransferase [Alkalicoccus luteus]